MPRTHSRSQLLIAVHRARRARVWRLHRRPQVSRPSAQAPAAYKELTPADFSKTDGWKVAQPQDNVLHGKWWEMFNDPQLNALEEQVNISNQNIAIRHGQLHGGARLGQGSPVAVFPDGNSRPRDHWVTSRRCGFARRQHPEPRRFTACRSTQRGFPICGAAFAIRCVPTRLPRKPAPRIWKTRA